jgi:hypothetical protein
VAKAVKGYEAGVKYGRPLFQKVINAVKERRELMFLHNTNADKLARQHQMGGMPMPSLAVTKNNIPFEGFGDITLVGKPQNFDPRASKLNQAFSADAYTVRAPRPVKVAKKGAGKQFQEKYVSRLKELGAYTSEIESNIWDLERKGNVDPNSYAQVRDFFERDGVRLFLDEKGIPFDSTSYADVLNKSDEFKDSGEITAWANGKLDEIFQPEEYFISNPNRDYYSNRAILKPYTADEIAKFMKRSAGRNTEGGMAADSIGGVRASTTEDLTSLKSMRDRKDRLVSSEDIAEFKQTADMMLDDLEEAFKPHYKYDQNAWGYSREFRDFVKISEQKGIKAAADEVGFDPPQGLIDELTAYKDMLRGGATEYFEAKPKRVVQLNEFGGAIVPKGTDSQTLQRLQDAGIRVESYADDAGRTEARKKFQDYMFQAGGMAVGTGALYTAAGAMAPQEAEAGPIKVLSHIDDAGRAVYKTVIDAWHGTPHTFPAERLVRMPDGSQQYLVGGVDALPDVPAGAELVQDFPFGRFKMDKIGTGEGAQAYGHGLYFADAKGIAEDYRRTLTRNGRHELYVDGQKIDRALDIFPKSENVTAPQFAGNALRRFGDIDQAKAALLEDITNGKKAGLIEPWEEQSRREAIGLVESMRGREIKNPLPGGVYRTQIDVDPDTLLDWDKPLSEQPAVMEQLSRLQTPTGNMADDALGYFSRDGFGNKSNPTGSDLMDFLREQQGSAQGASATARQVGIPGIRYADGMTRNSAGEKSYNYVMFDDKPINIVERGNANPLLLGGAALATGGAMALGAQDAEAGIGRQVIRAIVPGRWGDRVIDVVKNPAQSDYTAISKAFRDEYPGAPAGTPKYRSTVDENGETWLWPASEGAHFQIEPQITEATGLKVNQNGYFDGHAAPLTLAATAAGTGAGMAAYGQIDTTGQYSDPVFNDQYQSLMQRNQDALNKFSTFNQKRQSKRSGLDQLKLEMQTLLQGVNTVANDVIFPAMDKPMQGYLGLGAAFSALASGGSFDQAIGAGARAAQTPLEQTTYNMGGRVTDALSPYVPAPVAAGAGALTHAGALLTSPL